MFTEYHLAPLLPTKSSTCDDLSSSALSQLRHWQSGSEQLAFAYLRSGGGLIQTGRAQLLRFGQDSLVLQAGEGRLTISLTGAKLEIGPQMFFTAGFQERFNVEGVGFWLANHDWLFLAASSDQLLIGRDVIGVTE